MFHEGLFAFIMLLTTRTNLCKNVLTLRRYFSANYFSTWMWAGLANVNWHFWPGR
jgi:hypothetical protein